MVKKSTQDLSKVRGLLADSATPAGIKIACELFLSRAIKNALAEIPGPEIEADSSIGIYLARVDGKATPQLPDCLRWTRDEPPRPAPDLGGDPDLPPALAWTKN